MKMIELSKSYSHRDFEERLYEFWLKENLFRAEDVSDREPFCIVIPPPNVTGSLHMGHALTFAIQDMIVRWKRLQGLNTLWLPGTDHAGIATQMVVERELAKKEISRFDLGREKFLEEVWKWKEYSHAQITKQMKRLGVSVDWERERFTLDEGLSLAVRRAFVELYRDGLIYRAKRLVNWSPTIKTVLSDLEVVFKEVKGLLWHIAYPVSGGMEKLVVATTRPETMLGDTAVAVHPDDPRYRDLHGKSVRLPLTDREIPIITDPEAVDMSFGSGAVKITPGHDFADFETGLRHSLPIISIFDQDAKLNDNAPERYRGMDRFEARKRIVEDLEREGLLVKREDYNLTLGHCQRSGAIVEPMVSEQWFVKTKPLAEPAIRAVEDGRTIFIPEEWTKVYLNWMHNIRDWCISRQLWWGHQIPVWYCGSSGCDGIYVDMNPPTGIRCAKCGSGGWRQDEDVLDTWFSSALWPFSTLGWPEQTQALKTFYPTTVMETGFDIIFFWVARMMMMGLKFMGDVPFRKVYLHALVRDAEGQKMSKTKGNVIDPLDIVEKYGADSLRFTLLMMSGQGRDVKLSLKAIEGYKAFMNKIWNAARFILMNLEGFDPNAPLKLSKMDKWILRELNKTAESVNRALEEFRFNDAAAELYRFTWHVYCDWYIELSKEALKSEDENERTSARSVLFKTFDSILRLLHPFVPFITEELWQKLRAFDRGKGVKSIAVDSYPIRIWEEDASFEKADEEVSTLIEVVSAIRNIRGETGFVPQERVKATIKPLSDEILKRVREFKLEIERLGSCEIVLDAKAARPPFSAVGVGKGFEVYVEIGMERTLQERQRIEKNIEKIVKDIELLERKLSNSQFLENAPEEVVEKERERMAEFTERVAKLRGALASLES